MINIQNLSVSFADKKVLDNLSIDFLPQQVYGIVGLNGAGKTTFFNTLSTNLKPDEGYIHINGQVMTYHDIAYLETTNFFYSKLTGREYLNVFKQTNADFNLDLLQSYLQLPLDELIETYSTGMKKKIALLGILKQDKSVFLFDEPVNGLDLETNKIVELMITALKEKGKTVFLSSHIIEPLFAVCDFIHVLDKGKFTQSFDKADFYKIEDALFKTMKMDAKVVIAKAM